MKKSILTLLLALTTLLASAAVGDKVEKNYVTYKVTTMPTSDSYGRVTAVGLSASGKSTTNLKLTIPSVIYIDSKEYEVFDISSSAFLNCTNITSVGINFGLWGICSSAFQGCTNLTTVRIPSSCLSIESNAFAGCTKLTNVYFAKDDPRGYLYSSTAFPNNSGMTIYTSKTNSNSNENVMSIACFKKFSKVIKSSYAYDLATSDGALLVITKYPGKGKRGEVSLVGIQTSMLASDKTFKPFNYNGVDGYLYNLTSVADSACMSLTDLQGVNLTTAPYLTSIGVRSFAGCTALNNITLNDGLTSIKTGAFNNTKITTINLPQTVTNCSSYFVDRCSRLERITVDANNSNYSSKGGLLYNKSGSTLLRCPEGNKDAVFYANDFTSNLSTIAGYAFDHCTYVEDVEIPYGVSTISTYAFNGCNSMWRLVAPSTAVSWGKSALNECTALTDLYVNLRTPPTVIQDYFNSCLRTRLHIPFNTTATYKAATGWSKWGKFVEDAYDFLCFDLKNGQYVQPVYYSVISTKPETINGTSYAGRAMLSNVPRMSQVESMRGQYTLTVRDYVTALNKKFAVTCIAANASAGNTYDADIYIKLGQNVDSINSYAFDGVSHVVGLDVNPNLRVIEAGAFRNCKIANDIILPYGFKKLAGSALEGNLIKRILLPSTLSNLGYLFVKNNTKLEEIIINESFCAKYTSWDFTGVPTTCKVYVPVGCVQEYKNNAQWGKLKVTPGAYDFAWNMNHSSNYHLTITSATPVTKDGVTYAGTAKYVYHPALVANGSTSFSASNFEIDNTAGANKKYLITEFGDSCFAYSKVTTVKTPLYLERIGNHAFLKSALSGTFEVPTTCKYLGNWAFMGCEKLNELMVMPNYNNLSVGGQLWGGIATDFTCYVKWTQLKYWQDKAAGWTKFSSDSKAQVDRINGYFVENDYDVMDIAVNHPVNWGVTGGIQAYIVPNYNASSKLLKTLVVTNTPTNTGLLITGFEKGKIYKLRRPSTTPTLPTSNLLVGTAPASVDIYSQSVGFYFSNGTKKFIKPSKSFNSGIARSYLKLSSTLAGSTTEVFVDQWYQPQSKKGDVDGNGEVDITDANILINIILSMDKASNYNGRADVDGSGVVDITDANEVINIILSK